MIQVCCELRCCVCVDASGLEHHVDPGREQHGIAGVTVNPARRGVDGAADAEGDELDGFW